MYQQLAVDHIDSTLSCDLGPISHWLSAFDMPHLRLGLGCHAVVWTYRGNIIRTVLCWIMWHNVHSRQHTYVSSSYRSNGLGLSHWDPYAVPRGGSLQLYYCNMAEWFWWDSSLISTTNWFPSVLWHCWFDHLACRNRPQNDLLCVECKASTLQYSMTLLLSVGKLIVVWVRDYCCCLCYDTSAADLVVALLAGLTVLCLIHNTVVIVIFLVVTLRQVQVVSSAGWAFHIVLRLCVWMLTGGAQIVAAAHRTCYLACTDLLMNPDRPANTMSVWPTIRVKIARRKKWAWLAVFKPAEPHSPWDACRTEKWDRNCVSRLNPLKPNSSNCYTMP